jgi:catechol 2,3-dioxygenase-like lactoylglutathione lyase family enzyme
MITEITFAGTPVTDMARARKFYDGVPGWRQ